MYTAMQTDREQGEAKKSRGRAGGLIAAGAMLLLTVAIVAGSLLVWNGIVNQTPDQAGAQTGGARSVEQVLLAARALADDGREGEADAVLTSAVEQFPDDQPLRVALAEVCLQREQRERAYEQYLEALRIGPRDSALEFAAGSLASTLGDRESAAGHFQAAQTADPTNPKYPLYLAQMQLKLSRFKEASASLLYVIKLDPDEAWAHGTLADLSLRDNNASLAQKHAERAHDLDPENPVWVVVLAKALKRQGEAERALLLMRTLPDTILLSSPTIDTYAECCGAVKLPLEAADAYRRALVNDQANTAYAMNAALWYERAGDTPNALSFARLAQSLGDESAEAMVERLSR